VGKQFFQLEGEKHASGARTGVVQTAHGRFSTPVFMPVGTAASVRALTPRDLEEAGASIILCNMLHCFLHPAYEAITTFKGLHRFMGWKGAILTDSGGFQIFSLSPLKKITRDGALFTSFIDGTKHFFTPEKVLEIQAALGTDIAMVLDDCTPYPISAEKARESMELTLHWARRSRALSLSGSMRVFAIIQGSIYPDLREACAGVLVGLDFDGYAIGGLSVGEPRDKMFETVELLGRLLPGDKPRYLMGVGTPEEILHAVSHGIDMFDCVMPTRNARNGCLFTRFGKMNIKNTRFKNDPVPPDETCGCYTCRNFSRAYLRHLFLSGEILASMLNSCHNIYFYLDIMKKIRQAIRANAFEGLKKTMLEELKSEAFN